MRIVSFLFIIGLYVLPAEAQTDWGRVISGVVKAGRAATITDEELAEAVRDEVKLMDKQNKVCTEKSKSANWAIMRWQIRNNLNTKTRRHKDLYFRFCFR